MCTIIVNEENLLNNNIEITIHVIQEMKKVGKQVNSATYLKLVFTSDVRKVQLL